MLDINAIDFIRQLFLTNNYNEVKQLIISTPSLAFKITEEKKTILLLHVQQVIVRKYG